MVRVLWIIQRNKSISIKDIAHLLISNKHWLNPSFITGFDIGFVVKAWLQTVLLSNPILLPLLPNPA